MNLTTHHTDTMVIDTETESIYEVSRPDELTYLLEPVVGDKVIQLDKWGYHQHFKCGIFKYINSG